MRALLVVAVLHTLLSEGRCCSNCFIMCCLIFRMISPRLDRRISRADAGVTRVRGIIPVLLLTVFMVSTLVACYIWAVVNRDVSGSYYSIKKRITLGSHSLEDSGRVYAATRHDATLQRPSKTLHRELLHTRAPTHTLLLILYLILISFTLYSKGPPGLPYVSDTGAEAPEVSPHVLMCKERWQKRCTFASEKHRHQCACSTLIACPIFPSLFLFISLSLSLSLYV